MGSVFVARICALSILAGMALLPAAPEAQASELRTLSIPSDCIDPAEVVMSEPPAGKPAREPALRVNVVLPDGYVGSNRGYPVLYLLHGLGGAYDYWLDGSYGELAAAIDNLGAIVVMPEAGAAATYGNTWNGGVREPCWEHYFLDEVVSAIERRFRIREARRWHAIGGFSSGGLGAVLYAARLPGYFGQVLSFSGVLSIQRPDVESPAVSIVVALLYAPTKIAALGPLYFREAFGDPDEQEFYWTAHNPTALADGLTHSRVYLAHGAVSPPECVDLVRPNEHCAVQDVLGGLSEQGFNRPWAEDFVAAAERAGTDVTYRPQTGGHFYSYSARFLADAVGGWGLFRPVPERPRRWIYETASQTGEMWGHRFRFAKPPEVLETFVRSGRTLKGAGAGTVTIESPRGQRLRATLPFELRLPR